MAKWGDFETHPVGTTKRIEGLEAKLAKAVEWRPIETAPTDEAVLICGGDVLYPCVASLNNGEWDAEAQGGILREDIAECPTHWMPLPEPPSHNWRDTGSDVDYPDHHAR